MSSGCIKNEILFSGTNDNSYSYDANFNNRPNGAFSYYCLKVLRENTDPNMTYEEFYNKVKLYAPVIVMLNIVIAITVNVFFT